MITGVEQGSGIVFLSAVLVNNLVLEWQLALCPFLASSRRVDVATGMAVVSVVVMTVASLISFLIYHHILIPLELTYLSLLILVFTLVVLMQFGQWLLLWLSGTRWPDLHEKYGVFIQLLMLNCSVLAVVLLMLESVDSFGMAFVFSLGTSVGFGLVLIIFAGLRERLELVDVPQPFEGIPITLITLGILSMAFSGF
jgi:electron transport complex protein RnfA